MLKKIILRAIISLLLLAVYLISDNYFNKLENIYSKPVTISFKLPIPKHIAKKNNLPEFVQIKKVIIAGSFSEWHADDDNFKMKKINATHWQKTLDLNPGRNPYKFVIHLAHPEKYKLPSWVKNGKIWCEDTTAIIKENDAFDGQNSIHIIKTTKNTRFILTFILVVAGCGIIIFTIFEFLIKLLMYYRLSLKYKILIIFIVFLFISNTFFILYMKNRQTETIKTMQIDKVNILHNLLMSRKVDFSNLETTVTKQKIEKAFGDFFYRSSVRYKFNNFSNKKLLITRLFLLNKQGRLIHYDMEFTRKRAMLSRMDKKPEKITTFYQKKIKQIFTYYKQSSPKKKIFYIFFDDFPLIEKDTSEAKKRRSQYAEKTSFFKYDNFFYPIYVGLEHKGYYLVNFHPQTYSDYFKNLLTVSFILAALLIFIFFILINQLGKIILNPFQTLINGMNYIKEGNLDFRVKVNTRDEIEKVSNTYNYMVEKLKFAHEKNMDYARNLEYMVEERTKELLISESRFKNMTALLPTAVIELNPELNFTFINNAGTALFGIEVKITNNPQNLIDYIHKDDKERVNNQIKLVLQGETTSLFQYRIITDEDKDTLTLVNASPIIENNDVIGIRMTLTDIEPFLESALLPEDEFFDQFSLSKREKEIVLYLMQGYSYQGMAEKTFVAKSTIKTHIKHVYQKMNVSSRKELLQIIRKEREEKFGAASFILTIWNSLVNEESSE